MRFIIQLWSDEARPASPALVTALARFNEQLAQAGVLLSAEGLVASRTAVRLTLTSASERSVTLGPFHDGPTLGSGFWIVRASSKQEAVAWAKRCPLGAGDVLEVRELYGPADLNLLSSELAI